MAAHPPSPLVGPPPRRRPAPRRSRLLHRLAPLLAFAAVAFAVGIVLGSRHEPSERRVAARFASAWERGDYATMHSLLTAKARGEYPLRRFRRAYERAADTATLVERCARRAPRVRDGGEVDVDVTFADADLRHDLQPAHARRRGGRRTARRASPGARSRCSRACAAASGSSARRRCRRARRSRPATARSSPRARQRLSDLGPLASEIAGRLGPAPPEREEELARRGVPEGTPVGLTGLERTFDERLAGQARRHAEGGRPRARAQRAGGRRRRCARRSTRRSRRRR